MSSDLSLWLSGQDPAISLTHTRGTRDILASLESSFLEAGEPHRLSGAGSGTGFDTGSGSGSGASFGAGSGSQGPALSPCPGGTTDG